ncbi:MULTISPECIES: hypothetical protein [unclassified Sinorhizobium]|uniref:hypothetical protein n=1 Tax=unclassified Sinorhizobium TaxID=2613772 RepID=UPI00352660BF
MSEFPSARQVQDDALRAAIADLLAECTEKQKGFFQSIHENAPWKSLDNCPSARLAESYDLVCRTVALNRAARQPE